MALRSAAAGAADGRRPDAEERAGKGSVFTLTFVAEEVARAAAPEQASLSLPTGAGASEADLRGKRVLLVDDNRINRQVVKLLLASHGVHISEAANGQEALDALAAQAFDVVLLDIHMPVSRRG